MAWGDSKKVLDGDVLRFQWPSIGYGWEDGMLRFASAMSSMTSSSNPSSTMSDRELVERVLLQTSNNHDNTVMTVILGGKDKVVSSRAVKQFLEPYKDRIRIEEMPGLGHDPFEEDVPGFVDLMEQLLHDDQERILGTSTL